MAVAATINEMLADSTSTEDTNREKRKRSEPHRYTLYQKLFIVNLSG